MARLWPQAPTYPAEEWMYHSLSDEGFPRLACAAVLVSEILGIEAGYFSYRLRKGRIIGETTIQQIRKGGLCFWDTLATICRLLGCQPGDLIIYSPNADEP